MAGICQHVVYNVPSVGILRCSKNPVDARESVFQQRAKSLSLAGASATPSVKLNEGEREESDYFSKINHEIEGGK